MLLVWATSLYKTTLSLLLEERMCIFGKIQWHRLNRINDDTLVLNAEGCDDSGEIACVVRRFG